MADAVVQQPTLGTDESANGRATFPTPWAAPTSCPPSGTTTPRFAALEREHLWPRTWQMACRLEEIPSPGDFVEYTVGDQSVLMVRIGEGDGDGQTVRGYLNACRHRATELAKGTGTFGDGRIVCPFHGWRWNLDGENTFVYGAHAFDPELLTPDELCLRQARVEIWGGCAWVNLDPDAPPLLEALDPMPGLLDPLGLWPTCGSTGGRRSSSRPTGSWPRRRSWRATTCPATHPQLTLGHPEQYDPDSLVYSVHERRSLQLPAAAQRPGQKGARRSGSARSTPSSSRPTC